MSSPYSTRSTFTHIFQHANQKLPRNSLNWVIISQTLRQTTINITSDKIFILNTVDILKGSNYTTIASLLWWSYHLLFSLPLYYNSRYPYPYPYPSPTKINTWQSHSLTHTIIIFFSQIHLSCQYAMFFLTYAILYYYHYLLLHSP